MGAKSLSLAFQSMHLARLLQVESRNRSWLPAGRWLVALSWRRSVRPDVATFLKVVPGFERPRWRAGAEGLLGGCVCSCFVSLRGCSCCGLGWWFLVHVETSPLVASPGVS